MNNPIAIFYRDSAGKRQYILNTFRFDNQKLDDITFTDNVVIWSFYDDAAFDKFFELLKSYDDNVRVRYPLVQRIPGQR